MHLTTILLLLVAPSLSNTISLPSSDPRIVSYIPGTVSNESSIAQFISSQYGLDGPKVSPLNLTATNWWYFDCVGSVLKGSFIITFLMEASLIGDGVRNLLINLVATFPNGTSFTTGALATSAVLVGRVSETGANWTWTGDMGRYEVMIDSKTGI
jgi:hypothetical protein